MLYRAQSAVDVLMRKRSMAVIALVSVLAACDKAPAPPPSRTLPQAGAAKPPPVAAKAPTVAAPVFADLDLSAAYAHARCHGPGQASDTAGDPMAREVMALAGAHGHVERAGAVLVLGKAMLKTTLIDGADENGVEYEYLGGFSRSGVEVVYTQRYEDEAWTLVDPRNGALQEVSAPPLASPDGASFAAVGDDMSINEFNAIQIVGYQDGKFSMQSVDADYACDPVWLNADTLQLKVLSPKYRDRNGELLAGELPSSAWRTTKVVRKNGEWALVPPKP